MEEKKKWYSSKTVWANVIAGVATLTGIFGLDLGLDPETQASLVTGILAVVNIVLRFVTTKPVGK